MSITSYSTTVNKKSKIDNKAIYRWFSNQGFESIQFENGRFKVMTDEISNDIEENVNFTTFYKEDVGGSILVFEIRLLNDKIECIGYIPITLFGFYRMKVSFKEKSSIISKYRQHGYEYLTEFKIFMNNT